MTSPKDKARPSPVRMDDPEQSTRFIKAARELGIEEVGEAYERALERVLAAPKPVEPAPQPVAEGGERKRGRPRKEKPG